MFLFLCDLLIPCIMIIAGRLMWKHCPQKINGVVGYRTKRSMINNDTWRFAHDYCGKLWWKIGWLILVLSVLIHVPFYRHDDKAMGILSMVLVTIQCLTLIATIYPTEKALKATFDENGDRR